MLRNSGVSVLVALLLGCLPAVTVALAATESTEESPPTVTTAVISGPSDIALDRTLVLDASASKTAGERTEYRWTIDETKQAIGRGVEAIYTPEKAGKLTFRLTVQSKNLSGQTEVAVTTHEVVVFKKKFVVIADNSVSSEALKAYGDTALKAGVYLRIVQPPVETPVLGVEDAIAKLLTEKKDTFVATDAIMIWTEGIYGLQSLIRSLQSD